MAEIIRTENVTFDVNTEAQLLQLMHAHCFRSTTFIEIDAFDLHTKAIEDHTDFFETHPYQSDKN